MGRLLQLLLLLALAYVAWRLLQRALAPPREPREPGPPRFEPTARCARCGTHVPRDQLDAAGTCARCRATPG